MKEFIYKSLKNNILEIDVVPEKYCNFDCIYCPFEKTVNKTDTPVDFEDMDIAIASLRQEICRLKPELVYINPKGEGFINSRLEDIIDAIHNEGVKVKLLSNGYLFKKYGHIAQKCDEVVGEVKMITNELFIKTQRPLDGYSLEEYINNMAEFNKSYKGIFTAEVTIIRGYNDSNENIKKLKEILDVIKPDKLDVVRLEKKCFQKKLGITKERLSEISKYLNS